MAGGAHGLWEDGGRQRQLVGHAALTENPRTVLTLFLGEKKQKIRRLETQGFIQRKEKDCWTLRFFFLRSLLIQIT